MSGGPNAQTPTLNSLLQKPTVIFHQSTGQQNPAAVPLQNSQVVGAFSPFTAAGIGDNGENSAATNMLKSMAVISNPIQFQPIQIRPFVPSPADPVYFNFPQSYPASTVLPPRVVSTPPMRGVFPTDMQEIRANGSSTIMYSNNDTLPQMSSKLFDNQTQQQNGPQHRTVAALRQENLPLTRLDDRTLTTDISSSRASTPVARRIHSPVSPAPVTIYQSLNIEQNFLSSQQPVSLPPAPVVQQTVFSAVDNRLRFGPAASPIMTPGAFQLPYTRYTNPASVYISGPVSVGIPPPALQPTPPLIRFSNPLGPVACDPSQNYGTVNSGQLVAAQMQLRQQSASNVQNVNGFVMNYGQDDRNLSMNGNQHNRYVERSASGPVTTAPPTSKHKAKSSVAKESPAMPLLPNSPISGGASSVVDDLESSLSSPSWPRTPNSSAEKVSTSRHSSTLSQQASATTSSVLSPSSVAQSKQKVQRKDNNFLNGPALVAQLLGDFHQNASTSYREFEERRLFYEHYVQFCDNNALQITGHPSVSKQIIDLFQLYKCIKESGGYVKATKNKVWRELCNTFNINQSNSASGQIKKQYSIYLLPYECYYELNKVDPGPIIKACASKKKHKPKNPKPNTATVPQPSSVTVPVPSHNFLNNGSNTLSAVESRQTQMSYQQLPFLSTSFITPVQSNPAMSSQSMVTAKEQSKEMVVNPFDDCSVRMNHKPQTVVPAPVQTLQYPLPRQPTPSVSSQSSSRTLNPTFQNAIAVQQSNTTGASSTAFSNFPDWSQQTVSVQSYCAPPQAGANQYHPPADSYPTKQHAFVQPEPAAAAASMPPPAIVQHSQPKGNDFNINYTTNLNLSSANVAPPPNQCVIPLSAAAVRLPQTISTVVQQQTTDKSGQQQYHHNLNATIAPSQRYLPVSSNTAGLISSQQSGVASREFPIQKQQSTGPTFTPVVMPHLTNVSRPLIDLLSEPCSSTGFLRKEAFAPSSVEATLPKTLKRKKLSLRDVGKVDAWRLVMALKSGLHLDTMWALNILTILLSDESSSGYFDLRNLPGLLDSLIKLFRKHLQLVFDKKLDFLNEKADDLVETFNDDHHSNLDQTAAHADECLIKTRVSSRFVNYSGDFTLVTRKGLHIQYTKSYAADDEPTQKLLKCCNGASCGKSKIISLDDSKQRVDYTAPAVLVRDNTNDQRYQSWDICLCTSNILRSLSFVPGNEVYMAKVCWYKYIYAESQLLNYVHHVKSKHEKYSCCVGKSEPVDEQLTLNDKSDYSSSFYDELWFRNDAAILADDAFTVLCNIATTIDLYEYDEYTVECLLSSLIHWAICKSVVARDNLPNTSSTATPPYRYALEILCKLSILERNVDLILATPPWSRIECLVECLSSYLSMSEETVLREFAIVLLHAFCNVSPSVCEVAGLFTPTVDRLVKFLEHADAEMHRVLQYHGVATLRENSEIIGTSIGMLRRAAAILLGISKIAFCREKFSGCEMRLISCTISQLMDSQVGSTIAQVLYQLQYDETGATDSTGSCVLSTTDHGDYSHSIIVSKS